VCGHVHRLNELCGEENEAMCFFSVFLSFFLLSGHRSWNLFVNSGVHLGSNDSLFSAGGEHSAENISGIGNGSLALGANIALRHLQVLTGLTGIVHQGEISVIRAIQELVILARHIGHIHVVGRGADIFILPVGENVKADHVNLGMAVLAGLGGRHLHDFARASLDHNEAVLAKSRTLHGKGS